MCQAAYSSEQTKTHAFIELRLLQEETENEQINLKNTKYVRWW